MAPAAAKPKGGPKKRDHRTDGWRSKWVKKKKLSKVPTTTLTPEETAKRAAAPVKALRRATKKGKTFEIRKATRRLNNAKEAGGQDDKVLKEEEAIKRLKAVDLDVAVAAQCGAMPEMTPEVHRLVFEKFQKAPAIPDGFEAVLKTDAVKEALRQVAVAVDFNAARAVEVEKKALKKAKADARAEDDEDSADELGGGRKRGREEWNSEEGEGSGDSGDDSEVEDVSALIGDVKVKNRPGQRTRRKMILQQHGKDAKVFQAERERKRQSVGKQGGGTAGGAGQRQGGGGGDASMHPSWAAKQREKEAMAAALKGGSTNRKMNLEDSSSKKMNLGASNAGGKAGAGGKPSAKKQKELHPSWVAKMQAKEKAESLMKAVGEAKRSHIKFDDD